MTFTISQKIEFRSEDGVMWNIAQPDKTLTLTTIPARLFTWLLENAGRVITREELFNNIWEKYGYEPSNNSVNQYISLIRKSLTELGCEEEVIKTILRMGFYIDAANVSHTIKEAPPAKNAPVEQAPLTRSKTCAYLSVLPIGISLLIAAVLIIQPFSATIGLPEYAFPASGLYKIGTIDACPVYSLNKTSAAISTLKEQDARELAKSDLACIDNAIFIFQSDEYYIYKKTGRAFMTRCTENNAALSTLSDCKDIYFYAK